MKIGLGNGSNTVFKIPSVGNRQSFFVDKDASTTSTISVDDDVVAYTDGVVTAITSINEDSGEITLTNAPDLNAVVTADWGASEVSDQAVIEAMEIAEEITDLIIRGKNSAGNNYIQLEDGDGFTRDYRFDHSDVITINSVTVDGITKVIDTDYKLYKFKGSLTRYWYIQFRSTPRNDLQNIEIDYDHGEVKVGVTRLSEYMSARYILLEIKPSRTSGMFKKGDGGLPEKGDVSRLPQINREIKSLKMKYDRRIKYERA